MHCALLQITFPDRYTNACCSHPLHDFEDERVELNSFGIRKAAQRRLNYELGIPFNQVLLMLVSFSVCLFVCIVQRI